MKTLMLLLLLVPSVCLADGFHISVGVGIHDPAFDWHLILPKNTNATQYHFVQDPYLQNPLGIVKISYKIHRVEFGVEHISSIPNHQDNHGFNMAYVIIDIY
jgi:hypothetical protein